MASQKEGGTAMEQTLGKRIIANRKRIGFTQDQLAEKLGVTAQAVSKWENDQSCPDISILPKLAGLFGITIDELLGVTPEPDATQPEPEVYEGEVMDSDDSAEDDNSENEGFHVARGNFELQFDHGVSRSSLQLAVLILITGGLTLTSEILNWDVSFWSILWPTALLVFGLFGILPRFSFFRFGCFLFGGYFLLDNLNVLRFQFGWNLVLPSILLILGICLVLKTLFKPKYHFHRRMKHKPHCSQDGETFSVSVNFGGDNRIISLPRMSYGDINVSFGEIKVDLSGVEEIADACMVDANCSFGELTLLVPSRYRIQCAKNASFAEVSIHGKPDADTQGTIFVNANASFGEISIRYI
jgi:transcriptional regulator with XRE-family HTH domain